MIDSHFHLDYLKANEEAVLIQEAKNEGVTLFMTISVSTENLQTVIDISDKYKEIYCTQGIHPHDASQFSDSIGEIIKTNAMNKEKVLAIGEIGLDYHYDKSPRDIQKKAFIDQLAIATDLDLPIVIHTRDAEEDTLEIIKNHAGNLKAKGVFHSFTSKIELAHFALEQDFYIGFNGIITFKNAENVRKVVEITPLNRILLETDSPFLTPTPHRGKENSPKYLKHIAQKIAEIKNVSFEEVVEHSTKNFYNLFNPKI